MIGVSARFNATAIRRDLNAIRTGLGDRAIRSALNKTATQARTQMSAAIRATYNVSAGLVRDRLRVRKTERKGLAQFTAYLIGNPDSGGARRSMNLIHFLTSTQVARSRQRNKRGSIPDLRFKIKKTGGRAVLPGAFIGNAGRTVFIRTGAARLPIKAVRTIGVPQMFATNANQAAIEAWLRVNLPRIAAAEVRYFLSTVRK